MPLRKREGTSQTYGQLVTFASQNDQISYSQPEKTATQNDIIVSGKDVVVDVVPKEGSTSNGSIPDTERSKISMAAYSENSSPTAAVTFTETSSASRVSETLLSSVATKENIGSIVKAIVIGSNVKTVEEIRRALTESQKVDLWISIKSLESESIDYNTLKVPEMEAGFQYNFFEENEVDIALQESQANDPLLRKKLFDVPRYVRITWNPVDVTEALASEEKLASQEDSSLSKDILKKNRGVSSNTSMNFKNSLARGKKNISPFTKEEIKGEIVDIHKPDVAFDSTSNKKMFSNSLNAVLNTRDEKNSITNIPISRSGRNKR